MKILLGMNKYKNQSKKDDISKHLTIIKIKTHKGDGSFFLAYYSHSRVITFEKYFCILFCFCQKIIENQYLLFSGFPPVKFKVRVSYFPFNATKSSKTIFHLWIWYTSSFCAVDHLMVPNISSWCWWRRRRLLFCRTSHCSTSQSQTVFHELSKSNLEKSENIS